ncbi:MAG: type II toxin-antitoxin system RelE/ParE family toxin [Deltaproteobacteria bacterium]|nr:type II toxin-antitoxin system RelE/ParE family toxin [Deltaproteobacteria bacterium]
MKVLWSPEALDDLGAAVDYLAERSPPAAEKLVVGITALVERLATEPLDGPEHALANGDRVRGWPFAPFRIYYSRTPDALLVVRIYHQRREPITR